MNGRIGMSARLTTRRRGRPTAPKRSRRRSPAHATSSISRGRCRGRRSLVLLGGSAVEVPQLDLELEAVLVIQLEHLGAQSGLLVFHADGNDAREVDDVVL